MHSGTVESKTMFTQFSDLHYTMLAVLPAAPSQDCYCTCSDVFSKQVANLQHCKSGVCVAGMLRNLSSYYGKDAAGLHLVRVAQGLLHMGKGLTTINPYHSDRNLLSPLALASLLTVLHCGTNPTATLCGKPAYMLYYIVPAIRPRMLLTVDESGDVVPVSVRVGTAVDTVAQAGQPKSITGAIFALKLYLSVSISLL